MHGLNRSEQPFEKAVAIPDVVGCDPERRPLYVLKDQMSCIRHAETPRNADDSVQPLVGFGFTLNGAPTEPGEKTIRMRALDDEFANLAGHLTHDGLVTTANDASLAIEIAEQPGFECGFDLERTRSEWRV
jgi:hypothetical protein